MRTGRTQPGVELVARALGVCGRDQADDALRTSREKFVRVDAGLGSGRIEDEEYVEIRSVSELVAPELAHRHHCKAKDARWSGEGEARCLLQRGIGQRRERERGLSRSDFAAEVRQRNLERRPCFRSPECPY